MTRFRRLQALLALLLTMSLVAAACGDDDGEAGGPDPDVDPSELQEGGTVTFAAEQEPTGGFNPNTSGGNQFALGLMTELVLPEPFRTNSDLEVVMDENLLVSAEMTEEDPQTIVYEIHPDAQWSDGTPITADDFIFMVEMMSGENEEIDVATTLGYDRVASIEGSGENDKTVTMVFEEPFAEWRAMFENMMPRHLIEEAGDGDAVQGWNEGYAGETMLDFSGGPFMFENYQPQQSITLVPNENWWGDAPRIDEIVVRFDVDDAGIPSALQNQEIDMAYPQPQIDLVQELDGLDGVEVQSEIGLTFEHIDFNLRNEHLEQLEVRQAIALALDRDDLVRRTVAQFNEEVERLDNRIWLNPMPQYQANGEDYQEQDIDAARELLESVGYEAGGDGIYERDGSRLSLRIHTTGGNALRENTQDVIQAQLAEAGIEITIDNLEGTAVFDKFFPESDALEDQDFDIALYAWVGTPFPSTNRALYTMTSEGSVGSNPMGYQNDEVDALFAEALVETDQDRMDDLYNEIDALIWEDLPTIPLYAKPTLFPHRDTIENVVDNPSTAGPLWNAYQWGFRD